MTRKEKWVAGREDGVGFLGEVGGVRWEVKRRDCLVLVF